VERPVPAWRPLAGLIRSLSALFGRDPSQSCRDAVDVSSFDEAKRFASVAEEELRIIEAERRRLGLDA